MKANEGRKTENPPNCYLSPQIQKRYNIMNFFMLITDRSPFKLRRCCVIPSGIYLGNGTISIWIYSIIRKAGHKFLLQLGIGSSKDDCLGTLLREKRLDWCLDSDSTESSRNYVDVLSLMLSASVSRARRLIPGVHSHPGFRMCSMRRHTL
jgi:hypothetical protein